MCFRRLWERKTPIHTEIHVDCCGLQCVGELRNTGKKTSDLRDTERNKRNGVTEIDSYKDRQGSQRDRQSDR